MDRIYKPDEESLVDILQVEGVIAQGYGTIPKAVMKDRRLSIQAKALYAYFCSYAGAGSRAFPGRSIILKDLQISKDFYYKNLNQLKGLDYIRVRQEQGQKGKYGRNIYTLVSRPTFISASNSPCPAPQDTDKLPCPMPPDTVTQDTNNISLLDIDNLSIYHKYLNTDSMDRMEEYIRIVKENIGYDELLEQESNKGLVKSIFKLIIDTLCSEETSFSINRVPVDAQHVKKRFLELTHSDVSSVLLGISKLTEPIRSTRNYLLTALYNAPGTSETKWAAEIGSLVYKYREGKSKL